MTTQESPVGTYTDRAPQPDPDASTQLTPSSVDGAQLTEEQRRGLDVARALIAAGMPVFLARPVLDAAGQWNPAGGTSGYLLPTGWQQSPLDPTTPDRWRPGMALCAVTGHGIDALDTDPRNGGDRSRAQLIAAGLWPEVYGVAATPSGGTHELVAPLGIGTCANRRPGVDVKSGRADGTGRGFVWIAPTVRLSKDGPAAGTLVAYHWDTPPSLGEMRTDDDTGAELAELWRQSTPPTSKSTATPAATTPVVHRLAELPDAERAGLGRAEAVAVDGNLAELREMAAWPEGHRDAHGRGWEKRTADAAKRLGALGRADWTVSTLDTLRPRFLDACPAAAKGTAADPATKWAQQSTVGPAAAYPSKRDGLENWDVPTAPAALRVEVPRCSLDQAHGVFHRWLGKEYDTEVLDAVLAAVAVDQLDGDPAWLLVVSGSGAAKTETVAPLAAAGAYVTSTISSEGALLSGTSKKERTKESTGGLLRKIGDTGVLVIKDVTSVLSMNRDARGAVLAALREVYDGQWERNLGSDGGQSLSWTGRIVVIGAVTTAWDRAHEVIASMGDRFVLIRMDSSKGRAASGRQAIANAGSEVAMLAELGAAVAGILVGVDTTVDLTLTEDEAELILALADVVTLGRTGVEHDYRGDVIDAHAPEMPTRFAKQLTQLLRGGIALGMDRRYMLGIVVRCAADSLPPLRAAVLADLLDHPGSRTADVRKRIDKPRNTVDRTLQALHALGLLTLDEQGAGPHGAPVWRYSLADQVEVEALRRLGRSRNVGR